MYLGFWKYFNWSLEGKSESMKILTSFVLRQLTEALSFTSRLEREED